MPNFKLDFSKIPANNVADGEYDATLESVELRQSQNSEFPYLNWSFVLSGGEASGRKLYLTTSLSPKSLWNARDQFEILGFQVDDNLELEIDDESGMVTDPPLSNIPVRVLVFNEVYMGRNQPKISNIVKSYADLAYNPTPDTDGPTSETPAEGKKEKKPKLL